MPNLTELAKGLEPLDETRFDDELWPLKLTKPDAVFFNAALAAAQQIEEDCKFASNMAGQIERKRADVETVARYVTERIGGGWSNDKEHPDIRVFAAARRLLGEE